MNHGLSTSQCKSQYPCAWLVLSNLIPSDEVRRFEEYKGDERKLIAWLHYALNDRMFDKYLRLLLSNRSLLQ